MANERTRLTRVRAGDTEPLPLTAELTAGEELELADITTAVLYARKEGLVTNHVDGAEVTVDSLSATDNGDGTWDVVIALTFDPEGNGPDDGNAFPIGSQGTYRCYVKITWSDGDETRHPAADDGSLELTVTEAFE